MHVTEQRKVSLFCCFKQLTHPANIGMELSLVGRRKQESTFFFSDILPEKEYSYLFSSPVPNGSSSYEEKYANAFIAGNRNPAKPEVTTTFVLLTFPFLGEFAYSASVFLLFLSVSFAM